MLRTYAISLLCFAFFMQANIAKAATDTFLVHTDQPIINREDKLLLYLFYSACRRFKGDLNVQFYKYANNDSVIVLNKKYSNFHFKKGVNKSKIDFSIDDSDTYYDRKYFEILKRTNSVPPGSYKIFISVGCSDTIFRSVYLQEIDSVLNSNSPVRRSIDKSLLGKAKSLLGICLKSSLSRSTAKAGTALQHAKKKTDKVIKQNGLTSMNVKQNDKTYIDLYYQDWFAGRYEVRNKSTLSSQISQQEAAASTTNFKSITSNKLGSFSLFSQFKMLNNEKREQDELQGQISLAANVGNGQEENSAVDNNYYELKGVVELPVLGLPVVVEGLYTSQDSHRKIKSSYFRVHYDVEKIKEDFWKSVNAYNTKFSETKSKGAGMEQLYRSSLSKWEGQRSKLQNEINKELAQSISKGMDTTGMQQDIINDVKNKKDNDTTDNGSASVEKVTKAKEEALAKKRNLEEKRRQIEELERKIEKYKTLLEQNKNTNFFDSALGYAKTKDITNYSNMSYKQMAKKGTNILPDGKAKSMMSGLTSLDAGMFSKMESKYTMSGQMMKGVDVGYDIGFAEIGGTAGKTEYIGRDGTLDKYTCYSGRVSFKPIEDQKIRLVYYGYIADRKLYQGDGFFNNVNISTPSFFQPVHIVSANYAGTVSKYVTIDAETATSFKGSDKTNEPRVKTADKMAYHFNADGNIPNTPVSITAAYDKTGRGFENATLPITLKGTEQYQVSGKSDFFHSFLAIGIEYNRLIQNNFASGGNNTKWGFDIRTAFKRYPNIALSYKPFTTVHSYTDTLSIPQRPMLGSVWTGKASYQLKKAGRSLRFTVLYNRSMTTMDTVKNGNDLMQASCMYADKVLSGSINIGYMQITGPSISTQTTPDKTKFLNMSASYSLNKQISVAGGQDFGLASFGFCRYSLNCGIVYRPVKAPVNLRMNMRFNTYELNEGEKWKQLYSCNLEMVYRLKAKIKS